MFEELLNGLSPFIFLSLSFAACITSLLTASLGAGGGVMLLGLMAQVIPPQIIIPLHGVVQLGSNFGRAAMSYKHIDWQPLKTFLPGALLGSFLGHFVLIALPPAVMYLSIALFIFYLCWGPKLPKVVLGKWGLVAVGGITTFLTLFVGATGILVAAFIKQLHSDRFRTVATFAAAMSLQHICKIAVFQNAGLSIVPWLPLLLAMLVGGAIGTWIGLKLLKRISEHHFNGLFNIILSLLAVRLIWQAYLLL